MRDQVTCWYCGVEIVERPIFGWVHKWSGLKAQLHGRFKHDARPAE